MYSCQSLEWDCGGGGLFLRFWLSFTINFRLRYNQPKTFSVLRLWVFGSLTIKIVRAPQSLSRKPVALAWHRHEAGGQECVNVCTKICLFVAHHECGHLVERRWKINKIFHRWVSFRSPPLWFCRIQVGRSALVPSSLSLECHIL